MPKLKKGMSQYMQSASPPPRLLQPLFLKLTDYLGSSSTFFAILDHYTRPEEMDAHVRAAAAIVSYQFAAISHPFYIVQTKLSRSNIPPDRTSTFHLKSLLYDYLLMIKEERIRRCSCTRLCGVHQQRSNDDKGYPVRVKVVQIKRLPSESIYVLPKHKILEIHYSDEEVTKLRLCKTKANNKSCTDTNLYHVLDESKLQYTVEQDESVVLTDGDKVVAIAI
jgi:hypothetical protein